MKNVQRTVSLILTLIMLLGAFGSLSYITAETAPSTNESKIVHYESPAIKATVGDAVDLSSYQVEFSASKAVDGKNITFTSSSLTVIDGKVTADKKGVYEINAVSGSFSTKIYLVVKNASDSEYVLYEENYDSYANGTSWEAIGYRKKSMTSGSFCEVRDGKFVLGGAGGDHYVRMYLPEYLSKFQYYRAEYNAAMTNSQKSGRWMALVTRSQPNGYPYYQFATRVNATAENGVEFAFRNKSDKFVVPYKCAYTSDLSDKAYRTFVHESIGKSIKCSIDGKLLIETNDISNYLCGDIGFHVRGAEMSVDYIKIVLLDVPENESAKIVGDMANVFNPTSTIILPPAIITEITDESELTKLTEAITSANAGIKTTVPATAIFDVSGKKVLGGTKSYYEAVSALNANVIPGFRVKDPESAKDVATWLKETGYEIDAFIISDNAELLKEARAISQNTRAILDFSGKKPEEISIKDVRTLTNAAGARICLLPDSVATQANVEYLQRLFMTVWVKSTDTKISLVKDITSGANGIVTKNYPLLGTIYKNTFAQNTQIRPSNIIGHRGVPSLAQENSIKGAKLAYELGATAIENDIHLTKDGVIVVVHDDTLDKQTTGSGPVSSYTYEELQKFKIDVNSSYPQEPIPTLEEYFKEFKGKDVQIIIEIKTGDENICAPLKALIEKYDILDQINVISFQTNCLIKLKSILPEISVGYLTSNLTDDENDPTSSVKSITKEVQRYNSTYNPSYKNGALGTNLIKAASYRGITIWPYTINTNVDIRKYFGFGIAGITTNYTQYVSDCLKRVRTSDTEYVFENADELSAVKVIGTTYDREDKEYAIVDIVCLDGDDIFTVTENGQISASGIGSATVILGVSSIAPAKLTEYMMYTQPITITITGEPSVSDTEPPVSDQTTNEIPAATNQDSGKKSCAGFTNIWLITIATISLSAIALVKKKQS